MFLPPGVVPMPADQSAGTAERGRLAARDQARRAASGDAAPLQRFVKDWRKPGMSRVVMSPLSIGWEEGRYDWLPELATRLVRRQVSVDRGAGNTNAALAAEAATRTPIALASKIRSSSGLSPGAHP
jgi:hypothetical protein